MIVEKYVSALYPAVGREGIELHSEDKSCTFSVPRQPAHQRERIAEAVAAKRNEPPGVPECDGGGDRISSGTRSTRFPYETFENVADRPGSKRSSNGQKKSCDRNHLQEVGVSKVARARKRALWLGREGDRLDAPLLGLPAPDEPVNDRFDLRTGFLQRSQERAFFVGLEPEIKVLGDVHEHGRLIDEAEAGWEGDAH